jgi:glycerophosphoryl diester phosphodiesterase
MERRHHLIVPLISAHRGGRRLPGESAADRYRRAIALGVDYIEFDVRKSKNGVCVICHDDRTASGRRMRDFDFADLSEELAGEALTFEELLALAGGRVGLHLDLKESGDEAEIVGRALAAGPPAKLAITGGDDAIRAVKQRFPGVKAGLSIGDDLSGLSPWLKPRRRFDELFPSRRIERCRADFVAAHEHLARLSLLRYCARRHIPAWVWTVDREQDMADLLADPRVDVLITNRPELALRLRQARGRSRSRRSPGPGTSAT